MKHLFSKNSFCFLLLFCYLPNLAAQIQLPSWVQQMRSDKPNIVEVLRLREIWCQSNECESQEGFEGEKGGADAWNHEFERWIKRIKKVDAQGFEAKLDVQAQELSDRAYLQQVQQFRNAYKNSNSSWEGLGPFRTDQEASTNGGNPGTAHVYIVRRAPDNANVVYAGCAGCGVWKTTDGGANWTLLTRDELVTSVSAMAVVDANTVYFGNDRNNKIYKTTNGGTTWTQLGGTTFSNVDADFADIVAMNSTTSTLFAATDAGLFRTTDSGANWSLVQSGNWQEIEIKPADDSIVYGIKLNGNVTEFWKSIDSGINFTQKTSGWITLASGEEQKRTEIAVSAADPTRVYALLAGEVGGGSGLVGLYRSDDSGETWTHKCCGTGAGGAASVSNPNVLSYSSDGNEEGGQYYYDLALSVSPTNADEVYTGGIAVWKSTDGGTTLTNLIGRWYWSAGTPNRYIHADIHDIQVYADGSIWVACDGGTFYSADNGATFRQRQNGIQGTDFWGFAVSPQNGNVMLGGTYHNGTLMKDGSVFDGGWVHIGGGDDYFGAASPVNDRILFARNVSRYTLTGVRSNGWSRTSLSKTMNQGAMAIDSGTISYTPDCGTCFYMPFEDEIWYTSDNGSSFTLLKDFSNTYKVTKIEIAPSDPNTIYALQFGAYNDNNRKLWKSTNKGIDWTDITPTTAIGGINNAGFDITLDGTSATTLWLTKAHRYGWNDYDGAKVYKTTDGGGSWTNLTTTTLNDQHIYSILHQKGTNGGVYIGTDKAIYYRNNSHTDWQLYTTDLPVILPVRQLVLDYTNGKIIAATYGRSVYRADVFEASTPIADFTVTTTSSSCPRDVFQYVNTSTASASATFSWSFPSGTPATSTAENPTVSYTTAGSYGATLTITDGAQNAMKTYNNLITITDGCSPEQYATRALSTSSSSNYAIGSATTLGSTNTITLMGWFKPNTTHTGSTGLIFSASGAATGLNLFNNNQVGYHWADGAGSYNFSSGLNAPANEWSHIALVVNGTSATLYLNGIGATRTATHSAVNFTSGFNLGNDRNNTGRTFNGLIDEVRIYNRTLSQSEIREVMHLTGTNSDASLVSYYQFNETSGAIQDRVGTAHATLNSSVTRATSSAPVGPGISHRQTVSSSGTKTFTGTGLSIDFASGTLPNGEVLVSRINTSPDESPSAFPKSSCYWVITNFGSNSTFTALNNMIFEQIGYVDAAAVTTPSTLKLYKRNSRADGATWGSSVANATVATAGTNGNVTFGSPNITSFSQFIIADEGGTSLPIELVSFNLVQSAEKSLILKWQTASEINVDRFEIEKSRDLKTWTKLGTISTEGTSTLGKGYQFIDEKPSKGTNYYRLKIVDRDTSVRYSEAKEWFNESLVADFAVYPNPVNRGEVLKFENSTEANAEFILYDLNGRKITTLNVTELAEFSTSNLAKGVYFWQAKSKYKMRNGSFVVH